MILPFARRFSASDAARDDSVMSGMHVIGT